MAYLFIKATPKRKRKFGRMSYDLHAMYSLMGLMGVGFAFSGPHPGTKLDTLILNITFDSDEEKEVLTSFSRYQELRADLEKTCRKDKLTILESNSSSLATYLHNMGSNE